MDISQQKGSEIASFIWKVGSPIIFTVGVIGNLMTIAVLSLSRFKKTSTTIFLIFLAFADLSVIVIMLPRWWIIYMYHIDIRHLGNIFCKLHWFFTYLNGCVSSAFLVAVSLERIVSIRHPHLLKRICTVNTAIVISVTIIVSLISLHGHILYGMNLFTVSVAYVGKTSGSQTSGFRQTNNSYDKNTSLECISDSLMSNNTTSVNDSTTDISNMFDEEDCPVNITSGIDDVLLTASSGTSAVISMCWFNDPEYGKFLQGAYQVLLILVYNVLTTVVILIATILIFRHLSSSSKLRNKTGSGAKQGRDHSLEVTRSLLFVNFVFITCATPVQIFLLGRSSWVNAKTGMTEAQEIIWAVLNMLFYFNHAVNFILYFICTARFRREVLEYLKLRRSKTKLDGSSIGLRSKVELSDISPRVNIACEDDVENDNNQNTRNNFRNVFRMAMENNKGKDSFYTYVDRTESRETLYRPAVDLNASNETLYAFAERAASRETLCHPPNDPAVSKETISTAETLSCYDVTSNGLDSSHGRY